MTFTCSAIDAGSQPLSSVPLLPGRGAAGGADRQQAVQDRFDVADTSGISGFLGELVRLARRATARKEHLYCKICCLQDLALRPVSGTEAGSRRAGKSLPARVRALYRSAVATQVIVLNGGSSSGKSGVARCLQAVLPDPWLALGVDTLIEVMPASLQTSASGIEFAPDGEVIVGPQFRALEAAWMRGVAAMARAGARVIVDDAFLGGAASQQRWKNAFGALRVLWVGVRCEAAVAAGREIARGDRVGGMALSQAEAVHHGVTYDLEVDTTHAEALECARQIAACVH